MADRGPTEAISESSFDGSLPRSFLRPALHLALVPGPSHGYELLVQVHAFGLLSVDLGGIYRTLRGMDREALVISEWEASELGPPRRVYELTDAGLVAAEGYLQGLRVARNHIDDMVASVLAPSELLLR